VIYEAFAHTVTGFFDRATAQYLGVLLVVLQDVGHPAYFFVETRISHIYRIIMLVRLSFDLSKEWSAYLRICSKGTVSNRGSIDSCERRSEETWNVCGDPPTLTFIQPIGLGPHTRRMLPKDGSSCRIGYRPHLAYRVRLGRYDLKTKRANSDSCDKRTPRDRVVRLCKTAKIVYPINARSLAPGFGVTPIYV